MGEEHKNWICSTMDVEGSPRVQGSPTQLLPMGVAAKDNLWKKSTELKVRFLQGAPELHKRTLMAAESWFLDGVNLKLRQAMLAQRTTPVAERLPEVRRSLSRATEAIVSAPSPSIAFQRKVRPIKVKPILPFVCLVKLQPLVVKFPCHEKWIDT